MKQAFILLFMIWSLNKSVNGNRLKHLRNRLDLIETRQDLESISRKKTASEISERLDGLEKRVNATEEDRDCCDVEKTSAVSEDYSEDSVQSEVSALMTAFGEEKVVNARLRRQVPQIVIGMSRMGEELANMSDLLRSVKETVIITEKAHAKRFETSKSNITFLLDKINQAHEISEKNVATIDRIENKLDKFQSMFDSVKESSREILEKLEDHAKMNSAVRDTCSANGRDLSTLIAGQNDLQTTVEEHVLNVKDQLPVVVEIFTLLFPTSCSQLYKSGILKSGVYNIHPLHTPVRVFCDMKTDGGGWTVFQRRMDGSVDFYRNWAEYEEGFGNLDGEFWLGNKYISQLTEGSGRELRVDMEDFEGNKAYAKYGTFQVLSQAENYTLLVRDYSGNAGDSLSGHNNMQFSTKDRDNDKSSGDCAKSFSGAWWYRACHDSNLNGLYLTGGHQGKCVIWYHWKNKNYSLKMTEMKLREY